MDGALRVNPLKTDGATASTIKAGDKLICWVPGKPDSTHHLTISGGPYSSDEDDYVVDVIHPDGHESTELTSTLGLSPDRYNGKWTAIAIFDEEDD